MDKGSNKQFSYYLRSECNDESLQPLDVHNLHPQTNSTPNQTLHPSSHYINDLDLKNSLKKPFQSESSLIPLTNNLIRDFATQLGQEALEFFKCLEEVQRIESAQVLEAYREFYEKFQTVPVLFLSIVPDKAVYLWQVNRLCPYKKESNHMILDSKALRSETKPNLSVLMLGKILNEEDEEIIDAKISSDKQICVKSKIGEDQLVIRCYNVKDLVDIARTNPFKQQILANGKHHCKLIITKSIDPSSNLTSLEVTLWTKKTTEELQNEVLQEEDKEDIKDAHKEKLVSRKVCEDIDSINITNIESFSVCKETSLGVSFMIDEATSAVIAWRDNSLFVINCKVGPINRARLVENSFFMEKENFVYHKLDFGEFPSVNVIEVPCREMTSGFFDIAAISASKEKKILFEKSIDGADPIYHDSINMVYDVPVSVVNPCLIKKRNGNDKQQDQEDFKEDKSARVAEINNRFKHVVKNEKSDSDYGTSIKQKKQLLKAIRSEEKSANTLDLYMKVKEDKSRTVREREREKTKKKNYRSKHDDI